MQREADEGYSEISFGMNNIIYSSKRGTNEVAERLDLIFQNIQYLATETATVRK